MRTRTWVWTRAVALAAAGVLVFATPASAASWTVVSSPNQGTADNRLWSAEAITTSNAWAVGWSSSDTGERTLTMRWNGSSWAVVSSPTPPEGGRLYDVDGTAANDVWAVGTQILRWNGSAWSVVAQPSGTTSVNAVKALSPSSAWAVGQAGSQTAVLRWNGTSWTSVAAPSPGAIVNSPVAIDGSPSDLWAVGDFCETPDGYGGCVHQALILHWDGSAWSRFAAPDQFASLTGVVVLGPNDAWAVGSLFDLSQFATVPYAMHWNGTTWTRVTVPSPSSQGGQLYGITALSPTKLYAVGVGWTTSTPYITRWNGSAWTTESTPSASWPELRAATAVGPSTVWAVGTHYGSSALRTLTVRSTNG